MGHVAVLRAQGVPASAPMFIPFLGAFVAVKGPQRSVAEEAWSAIAGPIVGAVGALVMLQLAELNGSLLLRALAYTAFLINLFNLIPALPLDGGRVAGALHPAVWWVGMAGAVVLLLTFHSPVMILVLVLGGMEVFRRWRRRQAGLDNEYYSVPPATRLAIAATYLGVAALCVYGMHISYVPRPA
jgi:Zn-dependent protease